VNKPRQYSRQERPAASGGERKPAAGPDRARDVVHRALAHQAALFPELDLAPLDTAALAERDAAFAHAIYDAVLRRWITLEYVLGRYLSRPFAELEPRLRGVLLAGAAQMLLLDRVPPHAALNESVEWAKRVIKPAAGGLVNAVLRKVAGLVFGSQEGLPTPARRERWAGARDEVPLADGTCVKLREAILPEVRLDRLAVTTSHPPAVLRKWAGRFGEEEAARLATHGLVNPPTVLNVRFAKSAVPKTEAHGMPGHAVFLGGRSELVALLDSRADIWVQDTASGEAVASVANMRPRVILDVCAGQGTKTRQLAATFPEARVLATDVDGRRVAALRALAKTLGRIEVTSPDRMGEWNGRADLVLLDVPCSNTGVLPRRIEARYRSSDEQLERMVETQRAILRDAAALLAPRGAILYSTCSIEYEENEAQAAWAERQLGLRRQSDTFLKPQGIPGEPPTQYRDGAFSAILTRS
jgi:16S rRNA (cytosine967-C5)-methyltransferase